MGRTRWTTSLTSSEFPNDLLIFSPDVVTHALCVQYVANGIARRVRLRDLVLVVRENQVQPAAVDVERRTQVPMRHRRALQVPTRPCLVPTGSATTVRPGLAAFHSAKSRGSRLLDASESVGGQHFVDPLTTQRPVFREGAHVEVDVASRRRTHVRRRSAGASTRSSRAHVRLPAVRPIGRMQPRTSYAHVKARSFRVATTQNGTFSSMPFARILSSMSVTLRMNVTWYPRCENQRLITSNARPLRM